MGALARTMSPFAGTVGTQRPGNKLWGTSDARRRVTFAATFESGRNRSDLSSNAFSRLHLGLRNLLGSHDRRCVILLIRPDDYARDPLDDPLDDPLNDPLPFRAISVSTSDADLRFRLRRPCTFGRRNGVSRSPPEANRKRNTFAIVAVFIRGYDHFPAAFDRPRKFG